MFRNRKIKFLKNLANLQFALVLLLGIELLISVGTLIEQNQSVNFYKENYPELYPMFGFLTWKLILFLNWDKIYKSWFFFFVLFIFGSSLLACTFTTQIPSIKTFKNWKFLTKKLLSSEVLVTEILNLGTLSTFAFNVNVQHYHLFLQTKKGYAYSGLLSRIAPIFVHFSIIAALLSFTLGLFVEYFSQESLPRGELGHIQNLLDSGTTSYVTQNVAYRINNFWITYTQNSKEDQFYSDLSLFDSQGNEFNRKILFVNEPFVFENIFIYQTDWDLFGLKLDVKGDQNFQIPLKRVNGGTNQFWLGFIPLDKGRQTIVIKNLRGDFVVYDEMGLLNKESIIGHSVYNNTNFQVQVLDLISSSGLQLKSDASVNSVYFSFFFLITSVYVSFVAYSQIWCIESGIYLKLVGLANRSMLFFQDDFRKIIKRSRKNGTQ
jgi:cytochrome c biogenesis protein